MGQRIPQATIFQLTPPAPSPAPTAATPSPKPYQPQSPPESPSPYLQTQGNPPARLQASPQQSETAPDQACSSCNLPHKPASQTYPESPASPKTSSPSRAYFPKPPRPAFRPTNKTALRRTCIPTRPVLSSMQHNAVASNPRSYRHNQTGMP